jgi:hypothetical protein
MNQRFHHSSFAQWYGRLQAFGAAAFGLLSVFIFVASATALAGTTGALAIRTVSGAGRTPVKGATVVLRHRASGVERNAATDDEGTRRFENLAAGSYELTAAAEGFAPVVAQVTVAADESGAIEVALEAGDEKTKDVEKGAKNPTTAEEIAALKDRLAEADRRAEESNRKLEKLMAMVQELQSKLTAQTGDPKPAIGGSLGGLFGGKSSAGTTGESSAQDAALAAQSGKPQEQSTIDKLIKPKSEGGQFSGAEGLFKTDRLKIGGYADFRYVTRGLDDANEIRENVDRLNVGPDGMPTTGVTNFKRNGFTTPQIVLGVAGAITPKLLFNSEIEFEFAGEETSIEQLYLEYRYRPELNFRGGIIVAPLGRFNLFHDSNIRDIITRPLVSTLVIPSTYSDAGVGAFGTFNLPRNMKLSYEGYVVNGLRSDEGGEIAREAGLAESKGLNRFFDNNPQKSFVGRLLFSPFNGVEAGVSGYRGKHDNQGKYDLSILAFDGKFAKGGFQIVGEYARQAMGRDPEDAAEISARNFLLNLPRGRNFVGDFDFIDQNVNVPLFDRPARSSEGFYVETRYRFRPNFLLDRMGEDASIAPVFRYDQVNLDRSFSDFRFPLNQRRASFGVSLRPTEAVTINFAFHKNVKPKTFLQLPDGRGFPPYQTNIKAPGFTFGLGYAF